MEDFKRARAGTDADSSAKLIDELPMAYKDVDEVMENSSNS
jgi:RNA-splicing ligase RtcB